MTKNRRVAAVAVDVVETLFSLEAVEEALAGVGAGPHGGERFFTRLLRDGFALAASGAYRPFREVAESALTIVVPDLDTDGRSEVLAAFGELEAHPDAAPALERLAADGIPVAALTNGGADNTEKLLRRAGLDGVVANVISVDDVQTWKPAAAPYQHAASELGVEPHRLAMVAVHGWDIQGARRAGLVTGWAARLEGSFPVAFDAPDVTGADLVEVVDALLSLEAA